MAESVLKQLEALAKKLAKLTAGPTIESHATKDLSVVALIPEFTGRSGDLKVREFLEVVNFVGRMGFGRQDDKKHAAKFKLEETSRWFYLSNVELYDEHIAWVRFCNILETRFRFIETDLCHYQRLLEVRQGTDKDDDDDDDVLSFSDKSPCTKNFAQCGRSCSTKSVPTCMQEEAAVWVYK